jgi:hypothetical protein
MSPEAEDEMWGAITALNHLLEHTWAYMLHRADDPISATRTMRDAVMRDFDLPSSQPGSEAKFQAMAHAISILEDFWDRVEYRASPDRKPSR